MESDGHNSDALNVSEETLRRLPKVDLHLHLDGSLRLQTILDLGKKHGIDLPSRDPADLGRALHIGETCKDLNDYLRAFDVTLSVLQTPDAMYRSAYELAEDCAKENCWYIEVRYCPMLHMQKGMTLTTIVESVLEGLRDAERDHGIRSGVIICGLRTMSPEVSLRLAELCVAYKNKRVVGFDLAGAEYNYPAKEHKEAFYLILKNNVNCTAHAGEAYGPESIHQALHFLGAHRIGHGTRLREDGDLLNYMNDHRIPLEVCLSSNVQTRAVTAYDQHPMRFYYDYGLRTTVNTDNRLLTDTTVTKELTLMVRHFRFTLDDLKEITIYGFKSAFIPHREKQHVLARVVKALAEIQDEQAAGMSSPSAATVAG